MVSFAEHLGEDEPQLPGQPPRYHWRVPHFACQVCDEPAEVVHGLVIDILGGSQGRQDGGGERVQPVLEFIDLVHRRFLCGAVAVMTGAGTIITDIKARLVAVILGVSVLEAGPPPSDHPCL